MLALCTRFPLVEGLHLGAVPMNDALAFFGSGLLPFTHLTALSFDVLEHTHTLLAGIHTMFPALLTLDIAAADFRHKPSASLVVTHPALTRLSLRAGHASAGTTGTGTAAQEDRTLPSACPRRAARSGGPRSEGPRVRP